MTTTEDKKPAPKQNTDKGPHRIPVALLRLYRPMQTPGRQADEVVKAEKIANGRFWTIDFIPQIRHFEITCNDPIKGVKTEMLWEGHVHTWEAAAL